MSSVPKRSAKNRFRYGWRIVPKQRPDGSIEYEETPLTAEDFLDPQEGDQLIQGTDHYLCAQDLFDRLRLRYQQDPTTGVFSDLKMIWGIPGLQEPAPDVAVVPHLQDKARNRQSFEVLKEETRPCLVIEVISPHYPGDDTDKVAIYRQAGIQEYLIVKPYGKDDIKEYSVWGYRLVGSQYQRIPPNSAGFLPSQTTGVDFGVQPDRRGLIVFDHATGERLLSSEQREQLRELAERQAMVAKQEAEAATQRAEAATQQAEAAKHQAETAEQRAEVATQQIEAERQRSAKLAQRLRELGIDPDTIE
jgi:Uma2 family endonuclease